LPSPGDGGSSGGGDYLHDNADDEFAMFVNASIHPPNELSVPRCYPDPPPGGGGGGGNCGSELGVKQYVRSKSVGGGGGGAMLAAGAYSPYSHRHSLLAQKSLGSSPGKFLYF
jgi:hypothetical protein